MADRELIDKQMLLGELEYLLDEQEVEICDASFIASVLVDDLIQNAPVVERRKRGKWEESEFVGIHVCNVCHKCYVDPKWIARDKWDYCPHCGARLEINYDFDDEDEDDETEEE